MPIKNKDNLIIKSKVVFRTPKEWSISDINLLIIRAIQNEGLTYCNVAPSFVLKFEDSSILNPIPTNWEKFIGFIYGFLPRKNIDTKNASFLAYKRTLNSRVNENPLLLIITLTPKTENGIDFFEAAIEIHPIIYQRIYQGFIFLNSITNENFMAEMLSLNSSMINRFSSAIGGKIIEKPHYNEIEEVHQIFISHSQKDKNLKNFINASFASSNVKAVYEEYELLLRGEISKEKIMSDIDNSIAIFVLLSENVNNLKNTRDWVAFESGYGAALKKEVWVFEPIGARDKFSFITPGLTDYLPFLLEDETFQKYFAKIIKLYDYVYIPKKKSLGFPFICEGCGSNYKIHCPEDYSFPKNSLKCPVCNQTIKTEITPLSK